MLILCANTVVPSKGKRRTTVDGLDEEWQVNYLANFHLLGILSPALRAQPAHRDVRVIFTTCPSYIGAEFDLKETAIEDKPATSKSNKKSKTTTAANRKNTSLFPLSKLSLMIFAQSFQSHLNAYKRPDGQPPCTRVITVDPGFSRTPGTRRWLTGGSLWGLLLYLLTWPLWWLILKSPQQGAQSVLYAAMEARYGRGEGGWMIKECREVDFSRKDVKNEEKAKELWEFSEKQIEVKEKEGAVLRALEKKAKEEEEKRKDENKGAAKEQTPGSRRSRKTK